MAARNSSPTSELSEDFQQLKLGCEKILEEATTRSFNEVTTQEGGGLDWRENAIKTDQSAQLYLADQDLNVWPSKVDHLAQDLKLEEREEEQEETKCSCTCHHDNRIMCQSCDCHAIFDHQTQPLALQRLTCRQEALYNDITVDDLAGYLDELLYLPQPMSDMAELMYT